MKGLILLVNPWIYDFAAYNLWCESLGLLWIGAVLREAGYTVHFLDCLYGWKQGKGLHGTGKFHKACVPKPLSLIEIPRYYGRYGISSEEFEEAVSSISRPDLVLVTSSMTYWYPGVFEVIRRVRREWPLVQVILGGTYATLCSEHARTYSGADVIVQGEAEWHILTIVERCLKEKASGMHPSLERTVQIIPAGPPQGQSLDTLPMPAHDLRWAGVPLTTRVMWPHGYPGYIAIETSRGCPCQCTYCASGLLHPVLRRRSPEHVLEEITWYAIRYGVRDFAFYDDALLSQPEKHIHLLLDQILARGQHYVFHTPNALHAGEIDEELAKKMRRAGFRTIRLGLETSDPERQRKIGGKITNEHFVHAVKVLMAAGFTPDELGAYVLVGLPGQPLEEVAQSIHFVHKCGIQVRIAQYSPLPGTKEWHRAVEVEGPQLEEEPLLHNNTVFPLIGKRYAWKELEGLKNLAKQLNTLLVG